MQQEITNSPLAMSRRKLFSILPAGIAACAGCPAAGLCVAQTPPPAHEHTPAEKSDMTWEQIFRFTYQHNYIQRASVARAFEPAML
jgi:hypothetical protein